MELIVSAAAGLILVASLCYWLFGTRLIDRRRNLQMAEALDAIRNAANHKYKLGANAPRADLTMAFRQLEALAESCPPSVMDDLAGIRERWQAINVEIREFERQSTLSTLQSSITTTRTARLAGEITDLVARIESTLDEGG